MSERPYTPATPNPCVQAVLDYIEAQFEKLDRAAFEIRRDAIDLVCRVAAGRYDAQYVANIRACIAAGLYTSPHETLADDLKRVIAEVQQ